MAMKEVAERIKHLAHAESGGLADADYLLRRRSVSIAYPIVANTANQFSILHADKKLKLISASVVPTDTQSAGANSYSLRLAKNDGAGGANTNVSSLYDGTATAVTVDRKNAFTLNTDATEELAAGSLLAAVLTQNGTGGAATNLMFEVVVELL